MEALVQRGVPAVILLALVLAGGCLGDEPALSTQAQAWPEADELFHQDPRWLGSDGGYSVPLGEHKTLLLFGDSRIDPEGEGDPEGALFLSNVVGIMEGTDPSEASFEVHWRPPAEDEEDEGLGLPPLEEDEDQNEGHQAFFPDEGELAHWPTSAVRLDGRLLVFASTVERSGEGAFGFEGQGAVVFEVTNLQAEPSDWQLERSAVDHAFGEEVTLGVETLQHGNHLLVYGHHTYEDEDGVTHHDPVVARWSLDEATEGRLEDPEWYAPSEETWVDEQELDEIPAPLLEPGAADYTVHRDDEHDVWIHVQATGFGDTPIELRTGDSPTGPFSNPTTVYQPPEGEDPALFTYSGLAHPHMEGADLVATYSINVFGDQEPEDPQQAYYPRFVRADVQAR